MEDLIVKLEEIKKRKIKEFQQEVEAPLKIPDFNHFTIELHRENMRFWGDYKQSQTQLLPEFILLKGLNQEITLYDFNEFLQKKGTATATMISFFINYFVFIENKYKLNKKVYYRIKLKDQKEEYQCQKTIAQLQYNPEIYNNIVILIHFKNKWILTITPINKNPTERQESTYVLCYAFPENIPYLQDLYNILIDILATYQVKVNERSFKLIFKKVEETLDGHEFLIEHYQKFMFAGNIQNISLSAHDHYPIKRKLQWFIIQCLLNFYYSIYDQKKRKRQIKVIEKEIVDFVNLREQEKLKIQRQLGLIFNDDQSRKPTPDNPRKQYEQRIQELEQKLSSKVNPFEIDQYIDKELDNMEYLLSKYFQSKHIPQGQQYQDALHDVLIDGLTNQKKTQSLNKLITPNIINSKLTQDHDFNQQQQKVLNFNKYNCSLTSLQLDRLDNEVIELFYKILNDFYLQMQSESYQLENGLLTLIMPFKFSTHAYQNEQICRKREGIHFDKQQEYYQPLFQKYRQQLDVHLSIFHQYDYLILPISIKGESLIIVELKKQILHFFSIYKEEELDIQNKPNEVWKPIHDQVQFQTKEEREMHNQFLIRLIFWFLSVESDRLGLKNMELSKWKVIMHRFYENSKDRECRQIMCFIIMRFFKDSAIIYGKYKHLVSTIHSFVIDLIKKMEKQPNFNQYMIKLIYAQIQTILK